MELTRTTQAGEKPWDHTFRAGMQDESKGVDPNAAVEAAWGKPDWLIYYVPLMKPGFVLCEIGPGLGRWTRHVLDQASKAYLVDYSKTVCDYWRDKKDPRLEVIQCGNTRLPQIASESVDFFFSLDVFVHLNLETFYGYLEEAWRMLKPGGVAVIDYLSILNPQSVEWFRNEIRKQDCYQGETASELIFRFHDPRTIQLLSERLGFTFENVTDTWYTHSFCTLRKPAHM
jgi:ubiquinone/menaquinone biosynthesis C-methylase UbiE